MHMTHKEYVMCELMQKHGRYPYPQAERVSGDIECSLCGNPYYEHPPHIPWYDLTCLCDGRIVKL